MTDVSTGPSPVTERLVERAERFLPGGVSSSSRVHEALGRPLFMREAQGCRLRDVDGNEYVDFTGSSGASLLGFGRPEIDAAVRRAVELGTLCSAETEYHGELAERICGLFESAEQVRFVNTGTEATLAAIRIARAATGREKILRFTGNYHGVHDWALMGWGQESDAGGRPRLDSRGVPEALRDLVLAIPYNDAEAFGGAIARHGDELAAVILEPISFNQGCIAAQPGWLELVREETRRHGIVLIFDEVLSGFRMGIGGAQAHYGIAPDLTTLGKALGAGWPIAAVAGRESVLSVLGPGGGVPLSGTHTGHLSAVLAALAALDVMGAPGFYENLNARSQRFCGELEGLFAGAGIDGRVLSVGARFGMYFGLGDAPVLGFADATRSEVEISRRLVRLALERGLYFADFPGRKVPMHYGIGAAHGDADVDFALEQLSYVVGELVGPMSVDAPARGRA